MRFIKRKIKNRRGEAEESSLNVPLLVVVLAVVAGACGLIYFLVGPLVFGGDPEYRIVPYGQGDEPTLTPPPTLTPDLPAPTDSPPLAPTQPPAVLVAITADTIGRLELQDRLMGHSDAVSSLAFSPDGSRLASGDRGGSIRVWDVATGAELTALSSQSEWVESVAISADGTVLAAGGQDNLVRLWDLTTGVALAPLSGPTAPVKSLAFSPRGKLLAAGSDDGRVYVWDLAVSADTVLVALDGHTSYVTSVAFNPDGTVVAAGGEDDTIRLWKVPTGADLGVLQGHAGNVTSVTFSPDGSRLASTATGSDPTVRVWDVATQAALAVLEGHTESVSSAAFSPDGGLLVSAGSGIQDNTVRVWNPATGDSLRVLYPDPNAPVNDVAFSPDGTRLAVGGASYLALWGVRQAEMAGDPAPTATLPLLDGPDDALAATLPAANAATPPAANAAAVPTSTPDPAGCLVTGRFDEINLRAGPGTGYDVAGSLALDETVEATGWAQDAEGFTWWQLAGGSWVRADVVTWPDVCFTLPPVQP